MIICINKVCESECDSNRHSLLSSFKHVPCKCRVPNRVGSNGAKCRRHVGKHTYTTKPQTRSLDTQQKMSALLLFYQFMRSFVEMIYFFVFATEFGMAFWKVSKRRMWLQDNCGIAEDANLMLIEFTRSKETHNTRLWILLLWNNIMELGNYC